MTEISIKKEDLLQIGTDDCIKFDKLILRKTWRRKVASGQKCQSGVDVLNFHKIADCNKLFSYSQMCDLDLVWSRSLPCFSPYKFLWVRLGMLSVKLLLSLPPAPCTSPRPHGALLQAFRIRLPSWGQILYRSYEAYVHPGTQTSLSSVQGGPKSPGRFPILLSLLSSLPPPLGRWLERQLVEGRKQDVWWRNSRWSVPPYHEPCQNGRMAEQHSVPLVACSSDE